MKAGILGPIPNDMKDQVVLVLRENLLMLNEKARVYQSENEQKELAGIHLRLANAYLVLAKNDLFGKPGDLLIPENRASILKMASEHYALFLEASDSLIEKKTKVPALNILSEIQKLQGNINLALKNKQEADRISDTLKTQSAIAYDKMMRDASYEHDSIDLENEKRKLVLEQEIELGALKNEFQKRQAAAKSEEERRRIILEEEIKRKQIEYTYLRKQEREVGRQEKDKERIRQQEALRRSRLKLRWVLGSVTSFICLGLIAIIFIFRSRFQRLKLKNELLKEKSDRQLEEAEYRSRVNDITFTALRAQMNPHFIFNCLNSIKLYTEQNNTEAASQYLTKFSKLIRNMLDSGRAENIILSKELESLHLYLEMESMRFKQKLRYTIHVDKDIDVEFIEIPPLLIQPYVENAIWHGLMHKEEGGTIHIDVSQSSAHDKLIIIISDDGVGRDQAASIKSKTAVQHKSFGTIVTGERIALINQKYKAGAEVIITDLFNAEHQAAGTLVTIKLPIK